MLQISDTIAIPLDEIEMNAIRAQGAGGQNVNKVSNAVHCRFDINASSLPQWLKDRLLHSRDQRISSDAVVVIKAQQYRSLEMNKEEALSRLKELISKAAVTERTRRPTRPTRGSQQRRLESKAKRGAIKSNRAKVEQ